MLEENTKPIKEAKSEVKPKVETVKYTVIKTITLEEVHNPGSTIEVEKGSDLEKELLTGKFINKHGISRPN